MATKRASFIAGSAAAATAFSLPTRIRAQGATVKIGYIDSFSGPLADIGQHQRKGMQVAVDELNRRGGVRYELVPADDASKPATGVNEARRLFTQENIDVLMTGTSSAVTLAIGPLAEQTGIFTLAIGPQDTSITGEKAQRVVYRFAPNVEMQVRAVASRLLAQGKKWYFVVNDFAYGKDCYARLSSRLKAAGGTEIGSDLLPLGTNDYSATLTKVRNSDADVLAMCLGGFDGAKTAKQFVDFGLHKRMKLGGVTGSMEDYYWKAVPVDELAGSSFAVNWAPSVSDSSRALAAKLKAAIGDSPSSRYYFPYVCMMQLAERMHAAGTTKADALVAAFSDHRFNAYRSGTAWWRGCDHQCVQDMYCGSVLSTKAREKADFMFEIVADVHGLDAAGACDAADSAAATAAFNAQQIPNRENYTPKKV